MSVLSKALSFVALVALVSGCAVGTAPVTSSNESANDAPAAMDTAAAELTEESVSIPTQPADDTQAALESQTLATAAETGLGIEVQRGNGFTRLALDTGMVDPSVDVMTLTNPSRLVVDMPGLQASSNRAFPIDNDQFLKGVRLGAHNAKTRVVFDLTDQAATALDTDHTVDSRDGKVLVTFFNSATAEEAAAPAIAALPESDEAVEQLAAAEEIPAQEIEVIEPIASAEVEQVAVNNNGEVIVDSLEFTKRQNSSGEITVGLSNEAAYRFEQTAPSEYVLHIPGATASERTTLPQIAPQGFPGIRSARAVQEGNDVAVRMFIDPGVKLTALPRGNEVIIQADARLAAGARAQLADEPAEPAEPAAEEPAAEATPAAAAASGDGIVSADGSKIYTGRLISLDLQDTDIDNALRIIAEVSNLNIIASDDVQGKVTLRLIDVPWDQALDVILKTNGLDQVKEGNVIRIAPVDKLRAEREALREAKRAAQELEDLTVRYIRVSYARVTDLKEQAEAVLSERGSVSVDERTNQLIVKDILSGQEDVLQLIRRLDLRTPQVLLETQIVESQRNILRDLGFQWNFSYAASPQTGNSTGLNFPNSVTVGGSGEPSGEGGNAVNFPAVLASNAGSAVTAILDSADGSRALSARLSMLENEGKAKVISRPQVATVNNKQAQIKSVETVRVRLPDSGLSVATGSGASASGGGSSAFEEIDVGIELTVTPQASPDYFVLLDIHAKSSTFSSRVVDNIPSTLEREATSTILVKSGQTFALGGVYRIEDNDSVDGVPFLKDLPFLGAAFRRSLVDKSDEELIFFITPHIVEGSFDPSLM